MSFDLSRYFGAEKFSRFVFLVLVLFCTASEAAPRPQSRPLVQPSDFTYLGSFPVPVGDSVGCDGNTGRHCFTYGGNALAYNSTRDSLYFGGHDWVQQLAEIGIPSDFSTVAPVLQDLTDVTDGMLSQIGGNNNKLAATMVYNNRLIITGTVYYGALIQTKSHGASGLDLSITNDFTGFSSMNAAEPRGVSGWMTTIPAEWQSLLGGPALTGNCCYPGNQDTSNGPAAIVFNPDDVGAGNPIAGKALLYYPFAHPIAPYASGNLYYNLATVIRGIAFPDGSRSVLFFGRQGTGPYCYGPGTSDLNLAGTPSGDGVDSWCYDPSDSSKGTHAYPYRHQVWAYDANDLLAVKNGLKQPWQIVPYAVWGLNEMNSSGGAKIRGAAYDSGSGRLFITQDYAENPRVEVYQIDVSPGGGNPPSDPPAAQPSSVGIFHPATGDWILDQNQNARFDGCGFDACITGFGQSGDLPVVGKWLGAQETRLGVFRTGDAHWELDGDGSASSYVFGKSGDKPVAGDWTGTGSTTIGVFRPATGQWFFQTDSGMTESCKKKGCAKSFGNPDDLPIVGDWSGSRTTKIGVFRPSTGEWFLDFNGDKKLDKRCVKDRCINSFGQPGDLPIAGDWAGAGHDNIGIFRPNTGEWLLDGNGNGIWEGCELDICLNFGGPGDLPIVGKW